MCDKVARIMTGPERDNPLRRYVTEKMDRAGLSALDLERRVGKGKGLSDTTINKIRAGSKTSITSKTIKALARGLGVDLGELVTVIFNLPPMTDNPVIDEFIHMGQKYAQLDELHRHRVALQMHLLDKAITEQLRHQRGEIDDLGKPTTGDGLREATNGT